MSAALHAPQLSSRAHHCASAPAARRAAVARVQPPHRPCHRAAPVTRCAAGRKRTGAPQQPSEGKPKGFGAAPSEAAARGPAAAAQPQAANGYWTKLDVSLADLQAKPKTPLILANGTALMLWLVGEQVYCSAANGTAYQYPLIDAEVTASAAGATGPVVRSTLDGTLYELATGRVLEWCPTGDSPLSLRNLLAGLKQAAAPVDLAVYATRVSAAGAVEVLIPVKA